MLAMVQMVEGRPNDRIRGRGYHPKRDLSKGACSNTASNLGSSGSELKIAPPDIGGGEPLQPPEVLEHLRGELLLGVEPGNPMERALRAASHPPH